MKEVAQILSQFFDFCGLRQNELVLKAYAKAFLDRGWDGEKAKNMLSKWIEMNGRKLPSIVDLEEFISNPNGVTSRQLATQLAALIPALIHRHGQYWRQGSWFKDGPRWLGNNGQWYPSFEEAIQSYLGSLSSLIVERWEIIAEGWHENETSSFAQMRDLFEAHLSDQAVRTEAQALVARSQKMIQSATSNLGLLPDKQQRAEA